MSIVKVENVKKSYERTKALRGISLEIEEGELFGFIGPDGAGKTSLFRILTTLLEPDEGTATVLDLDVVDDYPKIRPLLGYMPGQFSLYQDLSVRENIDFFASVFGTTLQHNYELVEPIYKQLEPFEERLAGALSGGMKQKLALCCALIHKPELLILDEPTTGVDAVSRQEFWQMLQNLQEQNLTIIASTPYMDEAKQCSRIALIDDGQILQTGSPQEVELSFKKPILAIKANDIYDLLKTLREYPHAYSVQPFGEFIHYIDQREQPDVDDIETYLDKNELTDVEIESIDPGIEDSFIELMKRQ